MRQIHRIWFGPRPMPQRYKDYGQMWQDLNPGWELLTWTEECLPEIRNISVLADLRRRDKGRLGEELYVQMADVVAYELVWKFGGVYTNVDIQPLRPLDDLFDMYYVSKTKDAFASYEDQGTLVSNAVIGGPPEHPFWDAVIKELPASYRERPGEEMNQVTGPVFLTKMASKWTREDWVVLPQVAFNSVHWKQMEKGQTADDVPHDVDHGAIGIHHWGHKLTGRTNYVETATQP